MKMSSPKKSRVKQGMDISRSTQATSSTADPAAKDVIAFVRYLAQNFVISLNPYDGLEQWQKVLSGLAPGPVEIVLLPDGTASGTLQGISIVDRRSYMEAMKIVERVRGHDVLRFVLYPVRDETVETSQSGGLPISSVASTTNGADKKTSSVEQPSSATQTAAVDLEDKLQKMEETCPKWAADLRNDLIELVDRRFLELSASLEENLSMLGSQVSQSIASHANVSSASSRGSLGGSDTSLVVVPDSAELVKRSEVNGEDLSLSHLNSSVPAWISNLPPCTSPERTGTPSEEGRSQLTSKSTLSESGSVVVVTPPESFVVMGYGDGESEDPSGDQMTGSLQVATKEQLNQMLEQASETGSVVYVETDGEEDDDFTHLRSWAEDVSAVQSIGTSVESVPLGESFQSIKSVNSLENSFHSTASGHVEPVQDTIVYRSLPNPSPSIPASDREIGASHEESAAFLEPTAVLNEPVESTRTVPVNGSVLLPPDLHAMQPIDEQNLFSPSSDIGTMLLSAASSIATGFIQSMESLSKTISAYEERRARAMAEHQRAMGTTNTEQDAFVTERVEQDETGGEAESGETDDFQSAQEQDDPPPLPPRTFREPPSISGRYMSSEAITWYLREYRISELVRESWGNKPLTHEDFTERINDYFDRQR